MTTKKTETFDELANQLRSLDIASGSDGKGMLVARYVAHLSPSDWQEFRRTFPGSSWGALPVDAPIVGKFGDMTPETWGPQLLLTLSAEAFAVQIKRELARLARIGGELSIVGALPIAPKANEGQLEKLMTLLGDTLQDNLEICDSLGLTKMGHPAMLLLGAGQFRARNLAESIQKDFAKKASRICKGACCALGIVGMCQGEKLEAQDLLERLATSLEKAKEEKGHIFQIAPESLDSRSTLVHSSEKRFLFFGGDDI